MKSLILFLALALPLFANRVPVAYTLQTETNGVLEIQIPAGLSVYPDSLEITFQKEGESPEPVSLTLPPATGTLDEKAVYQQPVFIPVSFPAQPGTNIFDVTLQACSESACFLPQTSRFSFVLPLESETAEKQTPPADQPELQTNPPPEQQKKNALDTKPPLGVPPGMRSLSGYVKPEEFVRFLSPDASEEENSSFLEKALAHGGLWLLFPALFFAGILLNLTPCVLPLIPVQLALLGAGIGRASRRRGFLLGSTFALGITLAFGTLGILSSLAGHAFGRLHASILFQAAVAALFCLLALAMLDVFTLDFSRFRRPKAKRKAVSTPEEKPVAKKLLAAFSAGIASALLSGACVAPVLVSALLLSADFVRHGSPVAGTLIPFALGLGMGAPWPLLGAGFAALPKPGAWMEHIKKLFAALFLLMACLYAFRAYRMLTPPPAPAGNTALQPVSIGEPLPAFTEPLAAFLLSEETGAPILLSLTADWCTACHKMERTTLRSDEVRRAAAPYIRLTIDCTDPDSDLAKEAFRITGAKGLPFYAVLPAPEKRSGQETESGDVK